jgi:hypothetical protein
MLYLIAKALLSGIIIMAASEAAKRSPTYGALLVSLPLISIFAMVWLWRDTGDNERIAALSEGTFWLVLPTLPMFLVLPAMLRHGFAFWDRTCGLVRPNRSSLPSSRLAHAEARDQPLRLKPFPLD